MSVIEQSEIICKIHVRRSPVVPNNTKLFVFHGLPYHKVYHHEKEKWCKYTILFDTRYGIKHVCKSLSCSDAVT